MEFHQIRYFLALARTLNFTRAAETCNVTQPALTRAIQKLEEELGGPLLHRERNLTQLTELGRATLPHLEKIFAAAEATKMHAASVLKHESSAIRLGLIGSVSARTVVKHLAEVARKIPNLEVHMVQAQQSELTRQLNDDLLDVAVLADDGNLPERLATWPLFRESCHVVFPAGHRLEKSDVVTLAALAEETLIGRLACDFEDRLRAAAALEGIDLRFRHSSCAEDHVERLVVASFGVALVPEHLATTAPLVRRPLPERTIDRAVVIAAMHGRPHPRAVDFFIRLNRASPFAPGSEAA